MSIPKCTQAPSGRLLCMVDTEAKHTPSAAQARPFPSSRVSKVGDRESFCQEGHWPQEEKKQTNKHTSKQMNTWLK